MSNLPEKKLHAVITGVQGYLPSYVLTNAELETMVDTSDEWIKSRTGIAERRILKEPGKASAFMGAEAVKGLLQKTGLHPTEIELLICATVTADTIFPDNANTIAYMVGATNAWGFDINAACSGFLYALTTAAKFVETGMHKNVVVVGVDKMSSIVDYTDRATCIIFGDGAGAVLLQPTTEPYGIIDSEFHGDGAGREFLNMKAGGALNPPTAETVARREHFVYQDGKPVFKAAVKGMVETVEKILERNQLDKKDIDWLVPHQANKRIIDAVGDFLDLPAEKVMLNIQKYGNTTSGTLPLCLWDYEQQLKKGDKLLLTAFGGGFTWGTTYLKWYY